MRDIGSWDVGSRRAAQVVENAVERSLHLRAFLAVAAFQRAFRHAFAAGVDAFPQWCRTRSIRCAARDGPSAQARAARNPVLPACPAGGSARRRCGASGARARPATSGLRAELLQRDVLAEGKLEALRDQRFLDARSQFRADAADQAAQLERGGGGLDRIPCRGLYSQGNSCQGKYLQDTTGRGCVPHARCLRSGVSRGRRAAEAFRDNAANAPMRARGRNAECDGGGRAPCFRRAAIAGSDARVPLVALVFPVAAACRRRNGRAIRPARCRTRISPACSRAGVRSACAAARRWRSAAACRSIRRRARSAGDARRRCRCSRSTGCRRRAPPSSMVSKQWNTTKRALCVGFAISRMRASCTPVHLPITLQPSTQSWRVIWVREGSARSCSSENDSGCPTRPPTFSR